MKDPAGIIKSVQLTEKATRMMEQENKYFFIVSKSANKPEIARAIESAFKVSVMGVNTTNYPGKMKRERTAKYGRRPSWKRAVVTLKQGDSIDFV
jgi:large subunit ribosomal protein L23